MAFVVKKHLKLDFLGEGWEQAYLDFSGLTFKEVREFSKVQVDTDNPDNEKNLDLTVTLLENHFLRGTAFDGQKQVDVKKEDLGDLPVDALTKAVQLLVGSTDQNL